MVSYNSPKGTITNLDLELAGTIAQHDMASQCWPMHHYTVGTATDNISALACQQKGSTTTQGPATHLLCCQALRQQHF